MAGSQVAYGANEFESGLSTVSLRPCGPLALIPVSGEFGPGNDCSARPLGRRAVALIIESC